MKLEVYDVGGTRIASAATFNSAGNGQRVAPTLAAGTYDLKMSSRGNYGDIGSCTVRLLDSLPANLSRYTEDESWVEEWAGDTAWDFPHAL